jgi:F420-non-reducing hydrogenase iron-sulfur subunit
MNEFSRKLHEIGPLGKAEGIDPAILDFRIDAVKKLIPYIRLVERERLRVRCQTAEDYEKYFASEEVNRLFRELIAEKIALTEIVALLRERPRSTGEIADILGLAPSEASRHLSISAKQGLAKFDEKQKRFVTA